MRAVESLIPPQAAKMLNSSEDAHTKSMSTLEADEYCSGFDDGSLVPGERPYRITSGAIESSSTKCRGFAEGILRTLASRLAMSVIPLNTDIRSIRIDVR